MVMVIHGKLSEFDYKKHEFNAWVDKFDALCDPNPQPIVVAVENLGVLRGLQLKKAQLDLDEKKCWMIALEFDTPKTYPN